MTTMFTLISCIQWYHVYKDIWDPVVGKTLNCECEDRNPQDPYAVNVKKVGTTVGHVPRVIWCICTLFWQIAAAFPFFAAYFPIVAWSLAVNFMYLPRVFETSSLWTLAIIFTSLFTASMVDSDILSGNKLCLSHLKYWYKFFAAIWQGVKNAKMFE